MFGLETLLGALGKRTCLPFAVVFHGQGRDFCLFDLALWLAGGLVS